MAVNGQNYICKVHMSTISRPERADRHTEMCIAEVNSIVSVAMLARANVDIVGFRWTQVIPSSYRGVKMVIEMQHIKNRTHHKVLSIV